MKKLFLVLCCGLMSFSAFAASNCPATRDIELQGTQNGQDDEFIYTSKSAYDEVVACYAKYGAGAGKKKCSLGSGSVYECDKEQGCSHYSYLMGESGWVHGRKGADVSGKILECLKGPDRWIASDWKECSKQYTVFPDQIPGGYWTRINLMNDGSLICYKSSTQGYCCLEEEYANCLSAEHAIWSVEKQECLCGGTEKGAEASGLWKWGGRKCVESGASCDGTPSGGTQTRKGGNGAENCQKFMKNAEHVAWCYRTCDAGQWTDWSVHECEKGYAKQGNTCRCVDCVTPDPEPKPDPVQKTCRETRSTDAGKACCDTPYVNNWNEATQTCTCGAGEKFEIYDKDHGRCVKVPDNNDNNDNDDDNVVVPGFKCPELHFSVVDNCPEYTAKFQELTLYCLYQNPTPEGYATRVAEMNSFIANCPQKPGVNVDEIRGRIVNNGGNIAKLVNGWRDSLTVWKTKEGDFNTKRLASDSIAGVVLGTAGGLITSKVVKKNQVKSGFEDVQCTIGGQKVADWYDEFTVGVQ